MFSFIKVRHVMYALEYMQGDPLIRCAHASLHGKWFIRVKVSRLTFSFVKAMQMMYALENI